MLELRSAGGISSLANEQRQYNTLYIDHNMVNISNLTNVFPDVVDYLGLEIPYQSIIKPIDMSLIAIAEGDYITVPVEPEDPIEEMSPEQRQKFMHELEERMRDAAKKFEFEKAAQLRDRLKSLKQIGGSADGSADVPARIPVQSTKSGR